MEILLVAAGIAGLALILSQSNPLPSQADFEKAMDRYFTDPTDRAARTTIGKYYAFVQGDYANGMVYLAESNDPTLTLLAKHELDVAWTDTPVEKVAMGDEWVSAARKFPALSRIFYDRANYWYRRAWPDVDEASKPKLRERGIKIGLARPRGAARATFPSGFMQHPGIAGAPAVVETTLARTGSYSIKLAPADPKVPGSGSTFVSDFFPLGDATKVEASAWIFADGTEKVTDTLYLGFFDQDLKALRHDKALITPNTPFWTKVGMTVEDIPLQAKFGQFSVAMYSQKGNIWADDVSVLLDGKEALKNVSFEEK